MVKRLQETVDPDNVYGQLNSGSVKLIKVSSALVSYQNSNSNMDMQDEEDYSNILSKYYNNVDDLLADIQDNTPFSGNISDWFFIKENPLSIFSTEFFNDDLELASEDELEDYSEGKIDLYEGTLYIDIEVLHYSDPTYDDLRSLGFKAL